MDFASTRQENDVNLSNRMEAIRAGDDLEVLEPFAKAYLGLFYDIDSQLPPPQRIDLLANPPLSAAIKEGLTATLYRPDLPPPAVIARTTLGEESLTIGYAILAGISLQAGDNLEAVADLPADALRAAICFHHTVSTFHDDTWYETLLIKQPDLAADALLSFWQPLLDERQDFLPGLRPLLKQVELLPIFSRIAVPLLQRWPHCRHRDLLELLSLALRHTEPAALLEAARTLLAESEQMNLRNQVYWQGTAFLLAPQEQGQAMINFMGQEKIKLLPLLDFVIPLLEGRQGEPWTLSAMGYAYLIRCLAPKFTPQVDMHDNLGEITVKVLWLFYQLTGFSAAQGGEAMQWLRRVRVLKLYSDIFAAVVDYQQRGRQPDFKEFVQELREEGRLRMKKNWHDGR